jgi:hypothetical protein
MDVVRTKSAALTAAVAALPAAALLATAPTAHAVPDPDFAYSGGIHVRYYDAPLGLTADIWDDNNPDGTLEVCHYVSVGMNGTMPFTGNPVLIGRGPGSVYIPGQPLNEKWHVSVNCDGTGAGFDFAVHY